MSCVVTWSNLFILFFYQNTCGSFDLPGFRLAPSPLEFVHALLFLLSDTSQQCT